MGVPAEVLDLARVLGEGEGDAMGTAKLRGDVVLTLEKLRAGLMVGKEEIT